MKNKSNKEIERIAKKLMEENEQLFSDLAEGPNGEYHHTLEEKLMNLIKENKRLREENKELKTLLRNLR